MGRDEAEPRVREFIQQLLFRAEKLDGRDWLVAAGIGVLLFVAGLVAAAVIVTRIPPDYFLQREAAADPAGWAPGRVLAALGRNLAGLLLLAIGLVLALPGVPGPGALLMLVGLTLVDFPGKWRLVRRWIAHPPLRRTIDRLRARYGRPPLRLDIDERSAA